MGQPQPTIDDIGLPSTRHRLILGDARRMAHVDDESVALVVTSPPYWTLKKYPDNPAQLGDLGDYELFQKELARVWDECYRVLLPGGRLCVNVGDVTLSRRKHGRHRVVPLHADILTHARQAGFDVLTPIFWWKRTNMTTEMSGDTYFLGKPYEPNGIIKSEIEYILLLRKPGGYRNPPRTSAGCRVSPRRTITPGTERFGQTSGAPRHRSTRLRSLSSWRTVWYACSLS